DFVRLEVDKASVPINIGDWEGIDVFDERLTGITSNVASIGPNQKVFALTHYAGNEPRREGQHLLFRGKSGVGIYRNPDASPAAWMVHQVRQVPARELPGWSTSADLSREVILAEAPPALTSCDVTEPVRIAAKSANRITVEAHVACRGMMILSETYDPNW